MQRIRQCRRHPIGARAIASHLVRWQRMSARATTSERSNGPHAKGINFRSLIGASRRLLGPATLDKMVKILPPELGDRVHNNAFVTGGWYPLSDFRLLHGAALTATGRGPELTRALSRDCAVDDFRGIFRVLTFVLTPEWIMRRTPTIWSRYFDTGVVTVEARPHYARAHFVEASGFDHVLWQDVIGGSAGVLEVCGAKELKMTVESGGGDGDNHLALAAEWR
jgi:hypothetical protein